MSHATLPAELVQAIAETDVHPASRSFVHGAHWNGLPGSPKING
jgi:hypothetical protein